MIIQCMLLFTLGVNFVPIIYFFLNFPFFFLIFIHISAWAKMVQFIQKTQKKTTIFIFDMTIYDELHIFHFSIQFHLISITI